MLPIWEFLFLVVIDLMFFAVLLLIMLPLGIYRQAAFAVMKRNFVGYFSNPTGYVFLCLFVLLTSFAAFWPHEFFTTNLANFDQLNKFLPYIMLIFIPAITMSIWAEEKRQGTDELLLTLPAHDFDIVIGKYFAAVLVFTVSLVFSQLSNYAVLIAMTGGDLDTGLLFSTYLGYWFVGIAMIAIGMVASFLTSNLTVGFVFGVIFNAPLAFFSNADVIISNNQLVNRLYEWSLLQRLEPFARGLISPSSVIYFLGIVIIGVYLSLVLIGRRHWMGGRDGSSLLGHFVVRSLLLFVFVVAAVILVQYSPLNRARMDISRERVSTLTPNTQRLLRDLAVEGADPANNVQPVIIEVFIGANIPTTFVQTKYELVNLLREFDVLGGNRVRVNFHTGVEPFSKEAINAEKKYGIRPVRIAMNSRGAMRQEEVILGAAFTSGLERVVVPFFQYGMPVEYELIRSINTVAKSKRKTVGVVRTDALPLGDYIPVQGGAVPFPKWLVVRELEKQYDVDDVDLIEPLTIWIEDDDGEKSLRYDVLVVVQPSKMSPAEMDSLIDAINQGQPTAIFEDPLPDIQNFPLQTQGNRPVSRLPGTSDDRLILRNGVQETADIRKLWDALDISIGGTLIGDQFIPDLVWQKNDNPYPRAKALDLPEFVHIQRGITGGATVLDEVHPVTARITELMFQFASSVNPKRDAKLTFTPLVATGNAGKVRLDQFRSARSDRQRDFARGQEISQFFLAANITSPGTDANEPGINVIYVADVDPLADQFVNVRNNPVQNGVEFRFQNMSFVLNSIDYLAGEEDYIDVRNRRPRHVTLRHVEETTEEALKSVDEATQNYEKEYMAAVSEAQSKAVSEINPLKTEVEKLVAQRDAGDKVDAVALESKSSLLKQAASEQEVKLRSKLSQMEIERNENLRSIQLDAELKIQEIQRKFKLAAVIIPPIPPLIVGLIVFTRRRLREREGISKARRIK